jgi:peroxiredoxin
MAQLDPQPQPPADSQPVPRAVLIFFGLAALLLAAALLLYAYGRFDDQAEAEPLESIPAFSGTTESGIAAIQTNLDNLPEVGDPAPDFELTTLDGGTARLSDYQGRPVILNFWATWCAPCRLEMPELQRAQTEFDAAGEGPIVLTINEGDSAEQVGEFFDEVGLTLTALLDSEGEVGTTYGAFFLPTTIIVGPDGAVAAVHRGMISRDQLDLYLDGIAPAEGS